jgi:hypothetical protein
METLIATGVAQGATASSFSWGNTQNDGSYQELSSELDDGLYLN